MQNQALSLLVKIYKALGADAAVQEMQSVIGTATTSGPRDIVFVYDYSGSMSGSRHNTAFDCLKQIFHDYTRPTDKVSFIHFNYEVIVDVPMGTKEQQFTDMNDAFRQLTSPFG